jgi:hypothetical protein
MADAGLAAYNWAQMPLVINNNSPITQQQAVGQLIYHAAVALESDFEALATGSSPASVPVAFSAYFGYTSSQYQSKSSYLSTQWYNKIAAEIDAFRPVFYAMWQADGSDGHAVVCDGYRNGNEIHLNLGWSGADTAWYNIDTVSAEGITWTQHGAVFGITPPQANYAAWSQRYFSQADLNDPAKEVSVWGPLADPDADGRPNLLEYALGLNPVTAESGTNVMTLTSVGANQAYAQLQFKQRLNDPTLECVVEASADGKNWVSGSSQILLVSHVPAPGESGFELRSYQDLTPATVGFPRFMRLRVVQH